MAARIRDDHATKQSVDARLAALPNLRFLVVTSPDVFNDVEIGLRQEYPDAEIHVDTITRLRLP